MQSEVEDDKVEFFKRDANIMIMILKLTLMFIHIPFFDGHFEDVVPSLPFLM